MDECCEAAGVPAWRARGRTFRTKEMCMDVDRRNRVERRRKTLEERIAPPRGERLLRSYEHLQETNQYDERRDPVQRHSASRSSCAMFWFLACFSRSTLQARQVLDHVLTRRIVLDVDSDLGPIDRRAVVLGVTSGNVRASGD
jgi:hypothetical protein